jgi:Tol biopolymer transport system component
MNVRNDFDRALTGWLAEIRPNAAPPELLDETLERVATTERRPGWLILDRWTWSARARRWTSEGRLLATASVLLLIVLAVLAATILIGAPRPAPPFGLTNPGYITIDAAEGIVVARIDGAERRVLLARDGQTVSPIWSRDGLHLAFWHRTQDGEPWSLVVVDHDGEGRTVLADGVTLRDREEALNQPSSLTWSPDSRRVAFAADTPDGTAIFVADRDHYGAKRITDTALQGIDPAWSPNGSTIVFASEQTTTLHSVAPDGRDEHELADLKDVVLWPDWSPDGALVAVSAVVDGQLDVFTITADGSTVTNHSHDPSDEYSPSWSPDGTRLAWARAPADGSARAWIVATNRNGTRLVELRVPADLAPPVWSPDGTRLFSYVTNDAGEFNQILVLDPEGVAPVVRIPAEGNVGNGSWQRLP